MNQMAPGEFVVFILLMVWAFMLGCMAPGRLKDLIKWIKKRRQKK